MNENYRSMEDEIFCLRTELETLSGVLLRHESERWVPGFLFPQTEHSHLERYNLACKFSSEKKVLDIACGSGKGSNLLANDGKASFVLGCDISSDAIRYATHRYKASNLEYRIGNAQELTFNNEFDLIVSFETVEHLPDYIAFFSSVKKSLKSGGYFLVSTPISSVDFDHKPDNPYHIQEWGFNNFQNVLSQFFSIQKVFVQLYPHVLESHTRKKFSLFQRVYNKLFFRTKSIDVNASFSLINSKNSILEEYHGQYDSNQLSQKNCGYQILLLKKDDE